VEQGYSQAIADEILGGNFPRAAGLAEMWLRELPAMTSRDTTPEKAEADEAYELTRYLAHRHERLTSLSAGIERGRAFEEILHYLMQNRFATLVRRAAIMLCHAQIADNFARDFAGQKNYQLNPKDMLQLAYSLLMIGNVTSAREVLAFMLANHPGQAAAHYLSAHAANVSGNETAFFEHYRDALYLRPEVVSDYPEFLPAGIFQELYKLVHDEEYGEGVRDRIYALLLEVNGVYKHRRKLKIDEARAIEAEYRKLHNEYATARVHKKAFEPRLLQLLAMLIIHAQQMQNFEKFEQYRSDMLAIDHSIWQTFQQNNLASGNST